MDTKSNQLPLAEAAKPPPVTASVSAATHPLLRAERIAVGWALSGALGFALIINQVGEGMAKLLRGVADLSGISFFWMVNVPVANAGGRWTLAAVIGIISLTFYLLWRKHPAPHIRSAFYLGTATGGLILPFLAVSVVVFAGAVVVVGYALYWIFTAVAWLTSFLFLSLLKPVFLFLAIPFIWLWDKALYPILSFLGTPFVWLWDNAIGPLLSLIAIPFQWLWATVLSPVLVFLVMVVLKWVAIAVALLAAAVIGTLLSLGAFGAVWRVFEESFKTAAYSDFSEKTAFACGVGTGLFLFDVLLAFSLHAFTDVVFFPAISHFLLLLMPFVFLLRLAFSRAYKFIPQNPTPYVSACKRYWTESKLEIFVAVAVVPIALLISVFSNDDS